MIDEEARILSDYIHDIACHNGLVLLTTFVLHPAIEPWHKGEKSKAVPSMSSHDSDNIGR